MNANVETPCPVRTDGKHCDCWHDGGGACCGCGDNAGEVPRWINATWVHDAYGKRIPPLPRGIQLSVGLGNALSRNARGWLSWADVIAASLRDVLTVKNLGRARGAELLAALRACGVTPAWTVETPRPRKAVPPVRLVEHSGDCAHWTPLDALDEARKALAEDGGKTLMVAFVDNLGDVRVFRAGRSEAVTLLAAQVGQYEIRTYAFEV